MKERLSVSGQPRAHRILHQNSPSLRGFLWILKSSLPPATGEYDVKFLCPRSLLLKIACASFSKFNFLMDEDGEGGRQVVILYPISVNGVDFLLHSKFLSN